MGCERTDERILNLLSKHNYGLTIEEIAKQVEINRMTASKYLAILEATGKISVREVGKAKLHYPKTSNERKWAKLNSLKSSCGLSKTGLVFILFLFSTATIISVAMTAAYYNETMPAEFQASFTIDPTERMIILDITGPPSTNFSLTLTNPENKSTSPDSALLVTDDEGEFKLYILGFLPGHYSLRIESNGTEHHHSFDIESFNQSIECNRSFLEYRADEITNMTENESFTGKYVWNVCRDFVESNLTKEELTLEITKNRTFVEEENITNETIERPFVEENLNITETARNRTFVDNEDIINETIKPASRLFRALELSAEKRKFGMNENPRFNLTSKRTFSEQGMTAEKAVTEVLNVLVYGPDNKSISIEADVMENASGEYEIELLKKRAFTPGLYKIRVEVKEGAETYLKEDEFLWGVLAINTHKSTYLENEEAFIGIAVLDDQGRMVCDADVTLDITDPKGAITRMRTSDGTIKVSPECEVYGVTNLPDYYGYYTVNTEGTYTMKLTAITEDGERTMTDTFLVKKWTEFDVERNGPTRIYPPAKYRMSFTIKANTDYEGEIREYVPAGFEITHQQELTITGLGDTKALSWNRKLAAGETHELSYEFDAPDVSPYLFMLGPLEIGSWKESREWMIASDAPGLVERNLTLTEDVDVYKEGGAPASQEQYVYIEFDISNLPDYSTITYYNATLNLTRSQLATDDGDMWIYRVNDQSCDVTTDAVGTLDGYATNNLTEFTGLGSASGGKDSFNITDIVKWDWKAGNSKLCVRIQDPDEDDNTPTVKNSVTEVEMYTGQYDGDPARFWHTKQGTVPPYLTVYYDDSQDPVAELGTNPIAGYEDTDGDGTVTFDLRCSDNDDASTLKLYGNWSGGWSAKATNSSPINTKWWNVSVSGIPDGVWNWGVWCNDVAGNDNWSATNRSFKVNLGPSVTSPAVAPQKAKNGTNINITATVTDSDGISMAKAMLYYPNGTEWRNATMSTGGGDVYWSADVTVKFEPAGNYNVTIWANDTGGRTNSSEKTWFIPYLTLGQEKDILINGSFAEWSGITSVTDNGTDAGTGGGGLDNELFLTGLDNISTGNDGNKTIYAYNSTSGRYEEIWSNDSVEITNGRGGGEIGDVTHDGKNDFVISTHDGTYSYLEVWTYNSSGDPGEEWYMVSRDITVTDTSPRTYIGDIADFDNDGKNEILLTDQESYRVEIWGNDTENAVGFSLNTTIRNCAANGYVEAGGDLNGNNTPEIVIQCGSGNDIEIYEWNGTVYKNLQNITAPDAMTIDDMECGDLDRDTDDECVICGNQRRSHVIDYSEGTYSINYTTPPVLGDPGYTQTCAIGDITNDGWPDWFDGPSEGPRVFSYNGSHYVNVWNGSSLGSSDPGISSGFVGDADNDGKGEFILRDVNSDKFMMWENNSDLEAESFENTFNWSPADSSSNVIIGDLDSDALGGGGGGGNFDITNVSLANNNTFLFARIAVNGTIDLTDGMKYYRIFISTDDATGNHTTPENEELPFKYDYIAQVNGSSCFLFNFSAYPENESACLFNESGYQMEIGVNLTVLGVSAGDNVNITFHTGSLNPGSYDSAPDNGSFLSYDLPSGLTITAYGDFKGTPNINEDESIDYRGNCTCSGGSCENTFIRIQDNRTGSWSDSVTSHENVYVNVTHYNIGSLSGDSGNYVFNVTGNSSGYYNFRAVCNTTSTTEDPSDASLLTVTSPCSVSLTMTAELQAGVQFGEKDPGDTDSPAPNNGKYNITDNSDSACGTVNVSIRATSDLVNGSNSIGIGNVTVNSTSPDSLEVQLSTSFQLIRSGVPAGESNLTTFYFWLTVPSGQDPFVYNTTIEIREEME